MITHFMAGTRAKSGGGPPPTGSGRPLPVHRCGRCGAMRTGSTGHTCLPGRPS
jgi:hypothetical protein